ncbi:MAG: short-chain dehydrogenase, partial [Rhodococcus fascians]
MAPTSPITPDDLETCLRVLAAAGDLDADHPDSMRVQREVGHLFKKLKKRRRVAARDRVSEADRAVVAATATGSPDRIDDETAGIPLSSNVVGASAGTLIRARPC